MDKKILRVLVMSCFIFSVVGCGEDKIKRAILDDGYEVAEYLAEQKFSCDEIGEAVAISTGKDIFLTSDGSLYRFDIAKKYSNEKNCEKIEYSGARISTIIHNRLYDEEDNLLYIYADDILLAPDEYQITDTKIEIEYDFLSNNRCGEEEYIYIDDNTVYLNRNIHQESNREVLFEIPHDENILGIFGAIIKTDKNYYSISLIDEDCSSEKCTYNFKKSSLSDIYDNILFVSQNRLIDRDGIVYMKESCHQLSK